MSRQAATPSTPAREAASVHEQIVVAALALLDEEGTDALSTRKLGARVGIQAMSLYHHFPDRGAILDAAVDRMLTEVTLPNVGKIGWRRGLKQLALSYREIGHRHVLAVPLLAQRCPSSPNMTAFLDTLLGLLLKSGLSQSAAEAWLFIQRDYVIGSLMADHALHVLAMGAADAKTDSARFAMSAETRDRIFLKGFNAMLDAIETEVLAHGY